MKKEVWTDEQWNLCNDSEPALYLREISSILLFGK